VTQQLREATAWGNGPVVTTVAAVSPATNFYCHFEFKGGKKSVRANISIGDNFRDFDSADAR